MQWFGSSLTKAKVETITEQQGNILFKIKLYFLQVEGLVNLS